MANARKIAVKALLRVEQDGAYSNLILGQMLEESDASKEDKALASALFYGVLDRKITLDFYIDKLSKLSCKKLQPLTRQVLRIGIYQLYYMDKIPHSAAVDEAVKLIKRSGESRNSGYVNAVLRSAVKERPNLPAGKDLYSLSIKYSCPSWILSDIIADYGVETAEEILKVFLLPAKLTLRVNSVKISCDELFEKLLEIGACPEKTDIENSLVIKGGIDFSRNDLYKSGFFHIQDLSSQKCALSLGVKPGDRVLDVCASPGGKTFTIAENMNNDGEVVSCDVYDNKVSLIESGAKRLGLTCIKPVINDATRYNRALGKFDAVLCDVPCSGFGVIRRKPEIKYKPNDDFGELGDIQYRILCVSSRYVKNGGRLVYSTCTLRKAENDRIIEKFLSDNNDFTCESMHTNMPSVYSDGFFHAVLVRK